MARSRRDNRRDTNDIANVDPVISPPSFSPTLSDTSVIVDDLRTWHPEDVDRMPLERSGVPAEWRERSNLINPAFEDAPRAPGPSVRRTARVYRSPPSGWSKAIGVFHEVKDVAELGFLRPERVMACVRRKVRKEVMIAKRRKGRGGGRRNWRSAIKC